MDLKNKKFLIIGIIATSIIVIALTVFLIPKSNESSITTPPSQTTEGESARDIPPVRKSDSVINDSNTAERSSTSSSDSIISEYSGVADSVIIESEVSESDEDVENVSPPSTDDDNEIDMEGLREVIKPAEQHENENEEPVIENKITQDSENSDSSATTKIEIDANDSSVTKKVYSLCGKDKKSYCGLVTFTLGEDEQKQKYRLFFAVGSANINLIKNFDDIGKSQEELVTSLKLAKSKEINGKIFKSSAFDVDFVHDEISKLGFVKFINNLPSKDQNNLIANNFFFLTPGDEETTKQLPLSPSLSPKKSEIIFDRNSEDTEIKATFISEFTDKEDVVGLEIIFDGPEGRTDTLEAVHEGMPIQYNYEKFENMEINDVIDNIMKHGIIAEFNRQAAYANILGANYFRLLILASAEQSDKLLELVEKIKVEQEFFGNQEDCGIKKDSTCGILNIELTDEANESAKHRRVFFAYKKDGNNYKALESKYMGSSGKLSILEFEDLFANKSCVNIGNKEYCVPPVADEPAEFIGNVLKLVKLAGFKSYVDNLDKKGAELWTGKDVYLITPDDSINNDELLLVNAEDIPYVDRLFTVDLSKKYVRASAKQTYEEEGASYSAKIRVISISSELQYDGLEIIIEPSNSNYLLSRAMSLISSAIESAYNGVYLRATQPDSERSIIEVVDNIENMGLAEEFKKQYEAYKNRINKSMVTSTFNMLASFISKTPSIPFSPMSILFIGDSDKIKKLARTIATNSGMEPFVFKTQPSEEQKLQVLKKFDESRNACGPQKDLVCNVLEIKLIGQEYENDKNRNVFIAYKEGSAEYKELESKYLSNAGEFTEKEFLELFPKTKSFVINDKEYLLPQVEEATQSSFEKMLITIKLGGFKSFIDHLDSHDAELWKGNFFLIMPINDDEAEGYRFFSADLPKLNELLGTELDGVESSVKSTVKKFTKSGNEYTARLRVIRNIYESSLDSLLIEIGLSSNFAQKLKDDDKEKIEDYTDAFDKNSSKFSYKDLMTHAVYAYKDRNIVHVINNIEREGLENELDLQLGLCGQESLPNFSVWIVGEHDTVEKFVQDIAEKSGMENPYSVDVAAN